MRFAVPFDVLWSDQDPGGSPESHPGVSRNHFGRKTLTGILDEELGDEVFSLIGDVLPLGLRKVEMTVLDGVEEELLAGIARLTLIPTALTATIARERGVAAQQDVHDDPQGPQVAPLVVGQVTLGVVHEGFDDLGSHEFS